MVTSLEDLIIFIGLVIIIPWNLILFVIHYLKEGNTGGLVSRVFAFFFLLFMYAKRVLLAGVGIFALALSAIVFSTDSIISWVIALPLIGFFGLSIYYFYPQFIDMDDSKKRGGGAKKTIKKKIR